jgi:hypothetical protein
MAQAALVQVRHTQSDLAQRLWMRVRMQARRVSRPLLLLSHDDYLRCPR